MICGAIDGGCGGEPRDRRGSLHSPIVLCSHGQRALIGGEAGERAGGEVGFVDTFLSLHRSATDHGDNSGQRRTPHTMARNRHWCCCTTYRRSAHPRPNRGRRRTRLSGNSRPTTTPSHPVRPSARPRSTPLLFVTSALMRVMAPTRLNCSFRCARPSRFTPRESTSLVLDREAGMAGSEVDTFCCVISQTASVTCAFRLGGSIFTVANCCPVVGSNALPKKSISDAGWNDSG